MGISRGRCVMGGCRNKEEMRKDGGGTYDLVQENDFSGGGFLNGS